MRISIAISESNPRPVNAASAGTSAGPGNPATAAASVRTSSVSHLIPVRSGQAGEVTGQPTGRPLPGTGQAAQQRRSVGRNRPGVEAERQHCAAAGQAGRVEQIESLGRGQCPDSGPGQPLEIDVGEVRGHATARFPRSPPDRESRQSGRVPPLAERVQERVGRGVVRLSGTAEGSGERGAHDERGEVTIGGEFVQVHDRVHLRPQHVVDLLRRERAEDAVVHHSGGVHHGRWRVIGDQGGQCCSVSDVAGNGLDARSQPGQLAQQLRCGGSTAGQHQVADTVPADQVSGQLSADHAGAPGDQDRSPLRGWTVLRVGPDPGQLGHENRFAPDRSLTVVERANQRDRPGQHGAVPEVTIEIDQRQPARVLQLHRAPQPPNRGLWHVADPLPRVCFDSTARDEHQVR